MSLLFFYFTMLLQKRREKSHTGLTCFSCLAPILSASALFYQSVKPKFSKSVIFVRKLCRLTKTQEVKGMASQYTDDFMVESVTAKQAQITPHLLGNILLIQ